MQPKRQPRTAPRAQAAGRGSDTTVLRFFLRAAACLLLVTGGWWFVKDPLALPASWLSGKAAETLFSDVVREAHVLPQLLELDTYMRINMSQVQTGQPQAAGLQGELTVDLRPAKYGYSLPLLVALLLAGSRKRLARNLALGAVALLPVQAYSIVLDLIKQAVVDPGPAVVAQAGWSALQTNLLAYGYQLGVLLVPTLGPLLVWLWLDRHFLAAVLVEGWLRNVVPRTGDGPAR